MKPFIFTEGGENIGLGHVTRTLSIAQAFKEIGIEPLMVIRGDESVLPLVKEVKHKLGNWIEDRNFLEGLLRGVDVVIIDSYLTPKEVYEFIYKKVGFLVSIDDFKRIDYPGGIVVNGNIYAEELDYLDKDKIRYLLGTKYLPLRKPFWDVPNKEIMKKVEEVLITFGGDDSKNMTPKVLRMLTNEFPRLIKKVIIGRSFRNIEEIKAFTDANTELIFYPDAKKMRELMLSADIAISAGGQTLYELAAVGTPTISVAVADNQLKSVYKWNEVGFVLFAGLWNSPVLFRNIKKHINSLDSYEERRRISSIGRKYVDGKGSIRVIENLIRSI